MVADEERRMISRRTKDALAAAKALASDLSRLGSRTSVQIARFAGSITMEP
jgi:DNA invertase Pin-like site-specific DNA recombinase